MERKVKYKEIIECPKCKARISIEIGEEILTPSSPAEKEKYIQVELDDQTTLDEDEAEEKKKGKKGKKGGEE
jgi:nitrite reductase/ring-hydroxylating ferredoxin subunit